MFGRKQQPAKSELTPELLAAAWKLVEDPGCPKCAFCGGFHTRECPRVKRIAYYNSEQTSVQEVEFFREDEWDKSLVIFADLLPFPEEEEEP